MAPKTPEMTPAERAQRDADKVFHWIRLSGDKAVVKPAPIAAVAKPSPRSSGGSAAAPVVRSPEPVAAILVAPPVEAPPPTVLAVAAPTLVEPAAPLPPVVPVPEPAALPELPLKLINRVEPEIPRQLMGGLRSGSVLVSFVVLPDGSVQQAEVRQAANRKLAAVAIKAVSQWRFEPIAKARDATVELGFELEQ